MNFTEQDRLIYGPYSNGAASVHGDPLKIYRRLVHGLEGDPNTVLANIRSPEEAVRFEATEKMIAATVFAFDLAQFDVESGQGATESQVLALVKDFLGWIEQKKKTPENSPTSPLPTATAS
jgi:hypothetical protein